MKQFCLKSLGKDLNLIPQAVSEIYGQRERDGNSSGSLTVNESRDLILRLSEKYLQTTIIIDALDECNRDSRRYLFHAINMLLSSTSRIKIFLTSRYDDDIKEMFSKSLNHYLDAKDNTSDINNYIETQIRLRSDPSRAGGVDRLLLKGKVDKKLKELVISALQDKADGMYGFTRPCFDAKANSPDFQVHVGSPADSGLVRGDITVRSSEGA